MDLKSELGVGHVRHAPLPHPQSKVACIIHLLLQHDSKAGFKGIQYCFLQLDNPS